MFVQHHRVSRLMFHDVFAFIILNFALAIFVGCDVVVKATAQCLKN